MPRLADLATVALTVLLVMGGLRPALAQQQPNLRAALVNRIGLCQCLLDRTQVNLQCQPGLRDCEAACASAKIAFVPLGGEALNRCEAREIYAVLPNADGSPGAGAITVYQGDREILLDSAYAAAALFRGKAATIGFGASDTQRVFGRTIAARPALPRRFRVFFPEGAATMLPDSEPELRAAIAEIRARSSYQVDLIGNADTVASERANMGLSVARAQSIRSALVRAGVSERAISLVGRGDRDLLVQTAKDVPELRNRRVEIIVR